jgi:predicted enzyme related to lactoylglutathione lyase
MFKGLRTAAYHVDDLEEGKRWSGMVAYWGVGDAQAAYEHVLELGAREHEPVQDVGGGVKVATVLDPFANILGIIENPQFDLQKVE